MFSVWDAPVITIYLSVVAFFFGAVMGSFLNCAAYRIARGESFVKGRSHCPDCGHVLTVPDLIPVFSWLFLKGRCRHCGAKISVRYFLTELLFGLLTVGCLLYFDLTLLCLRNYIFICCLFCLALTDLDSYEIPNGTLIISAGAWLLWALFQENLGQTLLTGLLTGIALGGILLLLSLLMDKVLKKDSLGGGDIKLLAVIGLYFGPFGSLFTLFLSCILGLLFSLVFKRLHDGEGHFPFGPAIALSACIMLFAADPLVSAYMSLL